MGQFVIKLVDLKKDREYYLLWSTVTDAPVTSGGNLKKMKAYILKKKGEEGLADFEQSLPWLEEYHHNIQWDKGRLITKIGLNRAGRNESSLNYQQLIETYCKGKPIDDMDKKPLGVHLKDDDDPHDDGLSEEEIYARFMK